MPCFANSALKFSGLYFYPKRLKKFLMLTSESFFSKKQLKTGVIITIFFLSKQEKNIDEFFKCFLLFSKDGGKYTKNITIYDSHLNDSFLRLRSTSNLHKMHQSIQTLFLKVCHYYSEDFGNCLCIHIFQYMADCSYCRCSIFSDNRFYSYSFGALAMLQELEN